MLLNRVIKIISETLINFHRKPSASEKRISDSMKILKNEY